MRKKSRIALIVLLVAILGGLAYAVMQRPEPEPVYQGKPLSYWLSGLRGGPSSISGATPAPTHDEAQAAVRAIGTNAIPFLLKRLRQGNSLLEEKVFFLLQKQHFIKIQPTPPWTHAVQADAGLMELHDKAGSAVPQLIAIYDRHADPVQRRIITAVLAFIGPAGEEAVPMLLRGLNDTDELVRNNSAYALGRVHAKPELVVPSLTKALVDSSSSVRASAAVSLGSLGKDAKSALPALRELLAKERTATAGSNSAPIARFGGGTIVSYQVTRRLKGAIMYPLASPSDVIASAEEAIKAIDPAIAEADTNAWLALPYPRTR